MFEKNELMSYKWKSRRTSACGRILSDSAQLIFTSYGGVHTASRSDRHSEMDSALVHFMQFRAERTNEL